MALTLEKLLLLLPYDAKPDQLKTLDLSEKSIAGLPKQTAFLKALRRLSLAKNQLTDIAPVASIASLTHLDLSHNVRLTSLLPLKGLNSLVVLSVGNCGLRSLEGIEGSKGTLKSLVANDNQIILGVGPNTPNKGGSAAGLSVIAEGNRKALGALAGVIETIVLSRNPHLTGGYCLEDTKAEKQGSNKDKKAAGGDGNNDSAKERIIEDPRNPLHFFGAFEQLRKLSISECGVRCLPRRWFLPLLTELRLANNDLESSGISKGVLLQSLKMLDVSNNKLNHWNVLSRCKFLKQLAIKGNPLGDVETPMPTQTTRAEWEAAGREEAAAKAAAAAAEKAAKAGGKKGAAAAAAPPAPAPTPAPYVPDPSAPSSALHDNPLEVLYLRAVMPTLEILDGRKFVNPPPGATPADIQKGISTIHKKEHLARKAAAAEKEKEKEEAEKKANAKAKAAAEASDDDEDDFSIDEEDNEDDEEAADEDAEEGEEDEEGYNSDDADSEFGGVEKVKGDDEKLFSYDLDAIKRRILAARNAANGVTEAEAEAAPAAPKPKKEKPLKYAAAAGRGIRVGMGDDEDDDAAMDASLLSRRKRRREEEDGADGGDDARKAEKAKAAREEPKPRLLLEPIEDKEYEMPATIAAKASRLTGAASLVKRERTYAVGETAAHASNNKGGHNNNQKKQQAAAAAPRVMFSTGSDALAALRQSQATGGGW